MEIPLDHLSKIKINQHVKDANAAALRGRDAVAVILPEQARQRRWSELPHGGALRARLQRRGNQPAPLPLMTSLPDARGTPLLLAACPTAADVFTLLSRARKWAAELLATRPASLAIQLHNLAPDAAQAAGEALLCALLAAACPLPSSKSRPEPLVPLARIDLYGMAEKLDLDRIREEARGNHLARWLTRLPANELTPGIFRKTAEALAVAEGWRSRFLNEVALEKQGCGAFLAVTRGSAARDAGILQLRYRPGAASVPPRLALVGKGICFDTGGVNVKSARYMHGMHEDMAGAAVALGTFLTLSRLGVGFSMDCWLALAENHMGPDAYKPNDVVRACDGTSIEVIHTDAEGRMVLADTLALASRARPECVVDFATLTGSCIQALSTRYSGVLSNRPALHPALIAAGTASGERVWPFPLDEDFDDGLDSGVADVKQCSLDNEADHILAARFLQRFVSPDSTWIHVDLAAANHKGGLAHIPTDVTGFGVRFAARLLLDPNRHWNTTLTS